MQNELFPSNQSTRAFIVYKKSHAGINIIVNKLYQVWHLFSYITGKRNVLFTFLSENSNCEIDTLQKLLINECSVQLLVHHIFTFVFFFKFAIGRFFIGIYVEQAAPSVYIII